MSSPKSHKRIIVACDGTWVNSDNGWVRDSWLPWKTGGTLASPSNVTKLCRAIQTKSDDGVQQIVYYQGGLGSANNWYSFYIGGYLGEGISENIREAYAFICSNYEAGDEIILTGFSRGAFTARSVGGLISAIGLLNKHGLSAFYPIFKDWEHQTSKSFKPIPHHNLDTDIHRPSRPSFKNNAYLNMLISKNLTRPNIPIKAIGVFDTVGSLGIPTVKIFGIPLHTDTTIEYSFVNTKVAPNVEHAYQALALDECRSPFSPTIWESPDPSTKPLLKELKQTWFPGVHSNIGGGTSDSSISDITLAWMITQLQQHISFDAAYVPRQRDQNEEFYKAIGVPVRPWAMGLLVRKDGGIMGALQGRTTRTPGTYRAVDTDGKVLGRNLVKTCEFIHPSVRYRMLEGGRNAISSGKDDSRAGGYEALALKGWKFVRSEEKESIEYGGERWKEYGKWVKEDGSGLFIVEGEIQDDTPEMTLVEGWKHQDVLTKLYPTKL